MVNGVPFPQADDLEKIIKIINANNENLLHENYYVKECIGDITDRQVSYYISAAIYLGLMNRNRKLTELARNVRGLDKNSQRKKMADIILNDETFKKAYDIYNLKSELTSNDARQLIKDAYPYYSEAIYDRRSQTLKKWIEWIVNNKE